MTDGAILITGAGGFISGTLARHLAETETQARLVLTDIATHPRIETLSGRATFVRADLTDAATSRHSGRSGSSRTRPRSRSSACGPPP